MSKSKSSNPVSIFNFLCAALMAIVTILWFVPFWECDGTSVSMFQYIGMPEDHSDLTQYIASQVGAGYAIGDIVGPTALQLVFGVIAVCLCVGKSEKMVGLLFTLVSGACGTWGFLTKAAYKLGSLWGIYTALCALAVVAALFGILMAMKKKNAEYAPAAQ